MIGFAAAILFGVHELTGWRGFWAAMDGRLGYLWVLVPTILVNNGVVLPIVIMRSRRAKREEERESLTPRLPGFPARSQRGP